MTPGTPITTTIRRAGRLRTVAGVVLGSAPDGRLSLALEGQALVASRAPSQVAPMSGPPMAGVPSRHRNLAPALNWAAHPLHRLEAA